MIRLCPVATGLLPVKTESVLDVTILVGFAVPFPIAVPDPTQLYAIPYLINVVPQFPIIAILTKNVVPENVPQLLIFVSAYLKMELASLILIVAMGFVIGMGDHPGFVGKFAQILERVVEIQPVKICPVVMG